MGHQRSGLSSERNLSNLQAISEKGYVKRMKPNTFNLQNRGTIGKSVGKLRVNDAMSDFIVCRAHDHVLYFRYFLPILSVVKIDLNNSIHRIFVIQLFRDNFIPLSVI